MKKVENEKRYNAKSREEYIADIEKLYKLHSKKFNVIVEMQDPMNHYKFQALRIKIKTKNNQVPYYALFEQLTYPYRELQATVLM